MISPECDITRYCYYDISSNAMYYIAITAAITIAWCTLYCTGELWYLQKCNASHHNYSRMLLFTCMISLDTGTWYLQQCNVLHRNYSYNYSCKLLYTRMMLLCTFTTMQCVVSQLLYSWMQCNYSCNYSALALTSALATVRSTIECKTQCDCFTSNCILFHLQLHLQRGSQLTPGITLFPLLCANCLACVWIESYVLVLYLCIFLNDPCITLFPLLCDNYSTRV